MNAGMTLRDYFAGQIFGHLAAMEATHKAAVQSKIGAAAFAAAAAYEMADALIAERDKSA